MSKRLTVVAGIAALVISNGLATSAGFRPAATSMTT